MLILIYRLFSMLCFPVFFILGCLFSKKTRAYFFKRPSNFDKKNMQKTIWVHASSGEYEHAKFLIKEISKSFPLKKIVVTYSSPSYINQIKKDPHLSAYQALPVDLKGPTHSLVKRIKPEVVLFSRTDVWPELAHQLKKKNIPSILFARMESSKNSPFKKLLKKIHYKMTLSKVSHISFVSEQDKKEFLDVSTHSYLSVDGDPRVDEVFDKIKSNKYEVQNSEKDSTLILGSIWPEDLEQIEESIKNKLGQNIFTKIIIAPHEPADKILADLKDVFSNFEVSLLSEDASFKAQIILVDSVGKLFDLYSEASVAFIGGSFKKKVHSVIEPLSKGLSVVTGPYIQNNREAQKFSKKPYEFVKVCKNKNDLNEAFNIPDPMESQDIQNTIKNSTGSSLKVLALIEKYTS